MTLEEANKQTGLAKFIQYSKLMGPAWFAVALNTGGATVANAGSLASRTGFTYMWALLPATFTIWIACIMFTKVTLNTGMGPIAVMRTYLGEWAAWITGISIFVVNSVFHAIQYALVGNIMNTLFGLPHQVGAIISFLFCAIVVLNPAGGDNSVKVVLKLMKWIVFILMISFIFILFIVPIDWAGAARGFIPTMRGTPEEIVLLSGVVGASIAINVPSLGAYIARQNKWNASRQNLSVFELTYTNVIYFAMQAVIIIAVASVLYPQGIFVAGAAGMAETFRPFAGDFSVTLLSLGLLCAVLSTMAMQVLVAGYVITDLMKWEADMTSKKFKISEMTVTFFGLVGVLAGFNAFALAAYGSGFNMTFFPIVCGMMLIIGNKKSVMGENVLSRKMNIAIVLGIILALAGTANYWYNALS